MSYHNNRKYSSARAEWGDIFGLTPNDLTSQQLLKMQLDKLVEFIPADRRVDQIIADKMAVLELDQWHILSSIKEKEELDKLPQTILSTMIWSGFKKAISKNYRKIVIIKAEIIMYFGIY